MPASGYKPVQFGAATPTTSAPSIPDIASMETELQETGTLLSEISVKDHTIGSPLAHLQPQQLVQTPEGPKSPVVMPEAPVPGQVIQLASTAPLTRQSSASPILFSPAQAQSEPESNSSHYLLSGILIALTIATLSIVGIFTYRQYALAQAEATLETGERTNFLDFAIEQLPFVVRDEATSIPEATWEQ